MAVAVAAVGPSAVVRHLPPQRRSQGPLIPWPHAGFCVLCSAFLDAAPGCCVQSGWGAVRKYSAGRSYTPVQFCRLCRGYTVFGDFVRFVA